MIALYRAAAERAPDDLALAAALGRVYFELEMLDEAAEQFEKLEVRAPDLPVVHAFLGAVFERRGAGARRVRGVPARAPPRPRVRLAASLPRRAAPTAPTWQDRCPQCHRWNTLRPSADALSRPLRAWARGRPRPRLPGPLSRLRLDAGASGRRDPLCGACWARDRAPRAAVLRSLRSAVGRRSIRRRPGRSPGEPQCGACAPIRRRGTGRGRRRVRRAWSATRSTRSSSGQARAGAAAGRAHRRAVGRRRARRRRRAGAGAAGAAPASASAASTRRRSWPSDSAAASASPSGRAGSRGCGTRRPQSDLGARRAPRQRPRGLRGPRRRGRPPRRRRGRRAHDRRHRGGVRAGAARGGGRGGSGSLTVARVL